MQQLSRRRFLVQGSAAALAVTAAALPRQMLAEPKERPLGIQLYMVDQPLQEDVAGTLKKIREIGYKEVESSGFAHLTAKQFRGALDNAALKCHSSHLPFETTDLGPIFEDANILGAHYAISSLLRLGAAGNGDSDSAIDPSKWTLEEFRKLAAKMNRIGSKARQAGLQYAYHNHNFEFRKHENGAIGYDILLRETDPQLVKFELDCGWMAASGYSPVDYFKRYPDRYRLIHVKDFMLSDPAGTSPGDVTAAHGTELGRGSIPYKPILTAAKTAGVEYYYVEQEPPYVGKTPIEAAKADYDYLHSLEPQL